MKTDALLLGLLALGLGPARQIVEQLVEESRTAADGQPGNDLASYPLKTSACCGSQGLTHGIDLPNECCGNPSPSGTTFQSHLGRVSPRSMALRKRSVIFVTAAARKAAPAVRSAVFMLLALRTCPP